MEAIVIHPESIEQLKTITAVLKALNVPFEKQDALPAHVTASIEKGLEQYKNGEVIYVKQFKEKHFSK